MKRKQTYIWIGCVGLMMGLLVSCGTENEPTYTLTTTVTPDGTGTIEPASGEYAEGELVTITASSNEEGWQFKGWGGDLNDDSNPTTIMMTEDYSIVGVFERQEYNLEVLVEGQGSVMETIVSQPSGDYPYETVVELVATPENGWLFSRWEGDASGSTNPLSITIDGAKTVTAVFERQGYNLEVLVEGQGSVTETIVSQPSGNYPNETVVELLAVPSNGWRFVEWTGDVTGTQNPETIVMDGAKSVTAVFERQVYNLEVLVEGQGNVTETIVSQPSGDYPYETVVELVATPENGWLFSRWEGDASGSTNPLSITIDGAKSVTAVFEDGSFADVVNPSTGVTWMDRNLGASRVATSSMDASSYGDLYQWGRAADGHEKRNSSTTNTLSNSDQPGHGDFIIGSDDWRRTRNNNLWQGEGGVNNPCPAGYRIPTQADWQAERASWSNTNSAGAYGSPLKLPVAGGRDRDDGSLFGVGSLGHYWSSSVDGTFARFLYFSSSNAFMGSFTRASGISVRCRKN